MTQRKVAGPRAPRLGRSEAKPPPDALVQWPGGQVRRLQCLQCVVYFDSRSKAERLCSVCRRRAALGREPKP